MTPFFYYYVYRITCHHPHSVEKYYYGYRRCQCFPTEDVKYWSSSRSVHRARVYFGAEWFTKKILSMYSSRDQALAKEIRLYALFDVRHHPLFFNRANQTSNSFCSGGTPPSPETKIKISKKMKGNTNFLGKYHSLETREKIRQSMKT